jgi:hypothetical protein
MYATCDINPGDAICWAYGKSYWEEHYKGVTGKDANWVHKNYSFQDAAKLIPNDVKRHMESIDVGDPDHIYCNIDEMTRILGEIAFV